MSVPPLSPDEIYARNLAYARKLPSYQTQLTPQQESQFRQWLVQNKVPFEVFDPKSSYDMRGFWLAMQRKDPRARSSINPADKRMHYPDYWKTPYHPTFSNESQWAMKGAPKWNKQDQLVLPGGRVIFNGAKSPVGLSDMQ
jgi:hypothetical protein